MSFGSIYGTSSLSTSSGLAADSQSLNHLKMEAGKDSKAAIQETAKQFESLFMRELLKSMREASNSMKSGMLDNPGSDLGTDLLDQQFAVQMSGQPGGLSEMIAKELSRKMGVSADGIEGADGKPAIAPLPAPEPARNVGKPSRAPAAHQVSFVEKHTEVANRIEKASGIPASYMLGQAGHETGWGKFEIKQKGGAPSFNLFGIKAGAGWTGKVAEVTTTEYVNGEAKKQVAKFRAYDSYEDSFRDYARMISESPRYAKARAQTGSVQAFATGLQKAGYATDPEYAAKLSRAINTTLQLRRVQV
ncbi:flagellar assembly peptidoglycan hydrolase FlgJ [Rhodoferax saidenbachensis]|uniref:Peptidoglycan hydrolase FlgJ n=1 Tax=Rhodoferax saidenbachensis TaxID=1484693 RepID=A0A1P8K6D1_9BURK|nr:flagellar assembly peptidoglycan hydrolase FlgJ [Rhodoferax saidenbachensis]APW41565.1 flagellar rod assembly protein/muramidase FlgJ [Rhodoferax saidenbachensis]